MERIGPYRGYGRQHELQLHERRNAVQPKPNRQQRFGKRAQARILIGINTADALFSGLKNAILLHQQKE